MSVSGRARRAAWVLFVFGAIAASCALPGYEVGESSPGSTATAASGGGGEGGTTTASGAGGTVGSGGKGGAGGTGDGGMGGAGGNNTEPVCPSAPPEPNSPCQWPGMIKCFYPTPGATCSEDEFKCQGNDPSTATWLYLPKVMQPPPGCPENCPIGCPLNPPPPGCFCRTQIGTECNYNFCFEGAQPHAEQWFCPPPFEPNRTSVWQTKGSHLCCDPQAMNQCPGCAKHTDVNGKEVYICP